jgi:hypothetical protein
MHAMATMVDFFSKKILRGLLPGVLVGFACAGLNAQNTYSPPSLPSEIILEDAGAIAPSANILRAGTSDDPNEDGIGIGQVPLDDAWWVVVLAALFYPYLSNRRNTMLKKYNVKKEALHNYRLPDRQFVDHGGGPIPRRSSSHLW